VPTGKSKKKLKPLQPTESEGFGMPLTDVNTWCRYSSYIYVVCKVLNQLPSVASSRRIPIAGKSLQTQEEAMHPYTIQKSSATRMLAAITVKQERDRERDDYVEYSSEQEDPQITYFAHDGVNDRKYSA
jgi:hypothetical protein